MYGAGDVRVENAPDARIVASTDALVRVTRRASAAATLRYQQMPQSDVGERMGHEFIGPSCGALSPRAPGKTVAVVGDGAVGLCGVIAAKRLGASGSSCSVGTRIVSRSRATSAPRMS